MGQGRLRYFDSGVIIACSFASCSARLNIALVVISCMSTSGIDSCVCPFGLVQPQDEQWAKAAGYHGRPIFLAYCVTRKGSLPYVGPYIGIVQNSQNKMSSYTLGVILVDHTQNTHGRIGYPLLSLSHLQPSL